MESEMYRKLLMVALVGTCAGLGALEPVSGVVTLEQLNPQTAQENVAIELRKGDRLPLTFNVGGDVFAWEQEGGPPVVTIQRTLYMRITKEGFFFSQDLQDWKGFADFFTGHFGFSTGQQEGLPGLSLNLDTWVR
jgi:hypothetical protein